MSSPYPIVTEKPLAPAGRGGPRGWGRHRRAPGEIPPLKGEQVRVYLVDGRHVVDQGRRAADDPEVVRAEHVAVVDMSRNAEVCVELAIPSRDAKEFTIHVTFLCSVTDAVAVVRAGQGDAARALRGYVRGHQRLFQLGLDHQVSDVNQVRLLVQTQIEAYVQIKPPILPGMVAELASVEVLTPGEVQELHGQLSRQAAAHTIESERLGLEHELEKLKAENSQQSEEHRRLLEIERKKHETQMQELRLHMEEQEKHLRRQMTAAQNAFHTQQMDEIHDAVQGDPERAALFAQQTGELSMGEIAGRLDRRTEHAEEERRDQRDRERLLEDEDRTWMRQRADREWEYRVQVEQEQQRRRHALEDAQRELELKKLERIHALEDGDRAMQRELLERRYATEDRELERLNALEDKKLEVERERLQREYEAEQNALRQKYEVQAAMRNRQNTVQDRNHQAQVEREIQDRRDRIELLKVRLDMLKEVARHGHTDQLVIDAQSLVNGIAADTGAPVMMRAEVEEPAAALSAEAEPTEDDADDPYDGDESALQEEGLHDR